MITQTQGQVVATPEVTAEPRKTCPAERFGRPHLWIIGAFYWPLGGRFQTLYTGDEYVMCGSCGQIEREA